MKRGAPWPLLALKRGLILAGIVNIEDSKWRRQNNWNFQNDWNWNPQNDRDPNGDYRNSNEMVNLVQKELDCRWLGGSVPLRGHGAACSVDRSMGCPWNVRVRGLM
jgi:hypothetical protein